MEKETKMANRNQMAAARVAAGKAARELLRSTGMPAAAATDIRKAKSDPPVAVYDSQGRLLGFADPDDVQPVTEEASPEVGTPAHAQALLDASTVGPKTHPKSGRPVMPAKPVTGQSADGTDEAVQKADARFRSLLRQGTTAQDRQLRDGVARIATKLAYEHNVPIRDALHIAKSSIVSAAAGTSQPAQRPQVAEAHRLAAQNVIAYAAIRDRFRPITG